MGALHNDLTPQPAMPHNAPAGNKSAWSRNLFSIGVNTPLTLVVFLCASYCAALRRLFIMAGCFGHSKEWLATNAQFSTPFQPVAHVVENMIGGLHPSALE